MISAITKQVIADSLEAISREMSRVVERTAVHPLFQEVHDYSTGIFLFDGTEVSLVARATALPAHIFGSLLAVQALVDVFEGDMNDGDVFLLNDPYLGGSHQADFTMMRVVRLSDSSMVFPSVRAHMSDFGGVVPGGYNPDARDVWQEGYRIPPIRLYEKGELREEIWDLILANTRLGETLKGDLLAIVGGCNVGGREITRLIDKYSADGVHQGMSYILEYAAARFRTEVSRWPDGVYRGERILDHDSAGNRDLKVAAKVTVAGDRLTIDLSGSSPQSPGYVSSVPGTSISNALLPVLAVLPDDIPPNSGILNQVEVIAPEGSVVNPLAPAPVMFSTTAIGYEVADAVMKAFEGITPERVGEVGLGYCLCTTFGKDSRFDDELYFTIEYGNAMCSAGGTSGTDGWGAWPATVSALIMATIETQELQFPMFYETYEYADGSCGAGRWRGVPSFVMRRTVAGDHPAFVNLTQEGARNPLPGYVGGAPGATSYAVLRPGTPEEEVITESVAEAELRPGETLFTFKGGGGGWGSPQERDPEAVLEDVFDSYVSPEEAKELYKVALREGETGRLEVDERATQGLRSA
ncbi:MAG: hypothetical protein GEU71_03055 [Actinobacteria bacterium]|nr:hypothetical protein [Actinomycetota bacterium]